jgi:plasmid stability protein
MRFLVTLFILLMATRAAASPEKVTRFLDGALVETEAATATGRVEITLPRGMKAGSLRVRPLQDAVISRVEVSAARPDRKIEKETAQLTGRRDVLSDRLKALDVKEEIFRTSAKAQSGKAPRATKSNREPLEAIRKGTDFALARLEEVFRERRRTEGELRSIETRLSLLAARGGSGGVARVWLKGRAGRVAVSYVMPEMKWDPSYDFRVNGSGEVEITMSAQLPDPTEGSMVSVVPATLSEGAGVAPVAVAPGWQGRVAVFRMPLDKEFFAAYPLSTLSFLFTNRAGTRLPPGEAACYRKGEYIGTTRFDGSLPGEARQIDCGKIAAAVP